jgi:hypothetical protein
LSAYVDWRRGDGRRLPRHPDPCQHHGRQRQVKKPEEAQAARKATGIFML